MVPKLRFSFQVYPGARTREVFLCFVAIIFQGSVELVSLFYVTHKGHWFLHQGYAQISNEPK